jgi:hypothetical protein
MIHKLTLKWLFLLALIPVGLCVVFRPAPTATQQDTTATDVTVQMEDGEVPQVIQALVEKHMNGVVEQAVAQAIGDGLRKQARYMELLASVMDAADVDIDSKNADVLSRHNLYEPGGLTRDLVSRLAAFRKTLPLKVGDRCDLNLVTVHVKGRLEEGGQPAPTGEGVINIWLPRGESVKRLLNLEKKEITKERDTPPGGQVRRGVDVDDLRVNPGVKLVFWEEDGENGCLIARATFAFVVISQGKISLLQQTIRYEARERKGWRSAAS